MTGYSAETFGLNGRGLIADGYFADITVFDEFSVLDSANFEYSTRPAMGIELVLVNGRSVWENGEIAGNRPGRVLRQGG